MNLASHGQNCKCKRRTNNSIISSVPPAFDPSTFLEIVIGLHLAVEVSAVDCAITNVIAADRNINDKVV